MRNLYRYGGLVASVVLIVFGAGAIYTGIDGRARVSDDLAREKIVGTPDSTIPNQLVDTGAEAQAFANVIRKHTLAATGGQVYSEMPRFLTAAGKPTNDEKAAGVDKATGKPMENGARNIWVTGTALSTALNTSFFAESVATFAMVMGLALLLIGIGFLVMIYRLPVETAEATKSRKAAATKLAAGTA